MFGYRDHSLASTNPLAGSNQVLLVSLAPSFDFCITQTSESFTTESFVGLESSIEKELGPIRIRIVLDEKLELDPFAVTLSRSIHESTTHQSPRKYHHTIRQPMASPRPATLLQWLALLAMALPVTAAITLDDIEPITSLSISRNCLLTYRIPLQGCGADDFNGHKCSRSCAQGVLRIEDLLQLSCPDDTAPADSLLGMALGDQLLDHLCPDEPQTVEPTSFTTFESEGTTLTLTSVQPERATTSKAWAIASATMSTSTQELSSKSSTAAEGPVPTEGGKGPTAPEPTVTSKIESVYTTTMPLPTTTESSLLVTSDAVTETTVTSTQTVLANRPIRGGGGSPFDLPAGVRSSGQQRLSMSGLGAAFGTLFLGGLYLWL